MYENRSPHYIQQHSSPEVAQLLQSYEEHSQVERRELLYENRASHRIQQRSSPEVAQPFQSYEERLQVERRELLYENRAPHRIQQRSSPEVAQLLQCSPRHGGAELHAALHKSGFRRQYPNWHPPYTTADYQKMIRWMVSGHASPDVDVDDVQVRLNSVVFERRGSDVVQERKQFPCEANGQHGLVPTMNIVMNHQDKMIGL